jgi:hypothetical protein
VSALISEPRYVEVVLTRRDLIPREATESTFFPLVFPGCLTNRVSTIGRFKVGEMRGSQWTGFTEGVHVRPHIIDPDRLGITAISIASCEEEHVRVDALRIEDPSRQTEDRFQAAQLHHP